MIRCNPRDRYQTVDEVLKDIEKLPKLSTESPRITDDREIQPSGQRSPWLLPSAIALLLLGSVAYFWNTGWNPFNNISVLPTPSPAATPSFNPPSIIPSPSSPVTEIKASYNQLSIYLKAKNWKLADHETYLLLLKAAGKNSYNDGTFYPDEFSRITCADLVLIDQLWTQTTNGKQGLSAQKKIYEEAGKDIRKTYETIGWFNASEQVINTAYDRQTSRWEYIEGRQPNFQSPPTGHLPFLLRDPVKNIERMATLYRCSN
jgi:hypothetical protein